MSMYIASHSLVCLTSPNLKYFGLFHNNKFNLYRERTFIIEKELKGLEVNVLSLSDKGELLVLQNNELILYTFTEKNEIMETKLNNYFKEGGTLQNFALLPKDNKIFFTRKTQDKSIFTKIAKKDLFIQEIGILNINTKKEEIILTKKIEKDEDSFLFKLSPIANYILVADPQKMSIQKINLISYIEELFFSIDNVEIIDFFVNNEGDCAFILKEENKKGIYFIGKNGSKSIIKTDSKIEDFTILNFSPYYFVLKNKSYPELIIIDKHGEKFLSLTITDIDNMGYPFWVILFPNYEDIIAIYLKQFKLPSDIFFYSYSSFKIETVRWKAIQMKQKTKEEKELFKNLYTEQEIQTKEKEIDISHKLEEKKSQQVDTTEFALTEDQEKKEVAINKPIIDENMLNKKILEELKGEVKEIKYDPSSFLKFLEETEKEAEQKNINPKLKTKSERETPEKEISSPEKLPEINIKFPQTIEKKLETSESIENLEKNKIIEIKKETNIDNMISRIEKKIENKVKKPVQNILSQEIENEDLTIEIKKQITLEDIEKLELEKNQIVSKINELKFLKSIGEITPEEYEAKVNQLKKTLEEIKERLQKIRAG
ncbi:MAG: hypothetical protein RMJ36_04865 [Candidatus Calescibacterium sp.]|nr:hypothetical protein [Candidatus Calescibacterium sp.]MDW8132966.1 hypothetical protein [Candidatus Calescibacterium sp.]